MRSNHVLHSLLPGMYAYACICTHMCVHVGVVAQEPGWTVGTATYYTGIDDLSGGYSGNCGYGDLSRSLGGIANATYGPFFAAGSKLLYNDGAGCGACYEVQCIGSPACKKASLAVTITDYCPEQGNEQWCGADKHHFDLSGRAFEELVTTMAVGHFTLQWRRVSCVRTGPPVVQIEGNPFWQSIRVMNLGGGGTYDSLLVRPASAAGDPPAEVAFLPLVRDWGTSFVHNGQLEGPLSLKLVTKDPVTQTSLVDCVPKDWVSGSSYACLGASKVTGPEVRSRQVVLRDSRERLDCTCTCRG